MYKVSDLLHNIHNTRQTYINYFKVFDIPIENFIQSTQKDFNESAVISNNLYEYFNKNKDFFLFFYRDWHTQKTIRQLHYETGIPLNLIIDLFNGRKIYAKRIMPTLEPSFESKNDGFNIDTPFRYYSRYQVIELAIGKSIIPRP